MGGLGKSAGTGSDDSSGLNKNIITIRN